MPAGYPVTQSGRFDEDEHYYLDTEKDFGYIIELGNAGRIPRSGPALPASLTRHTSRALPRPLGALRCGATLPNRFGGMAR